MESHRSSRDIKAYGHFRDPLEGGGGDKGGRRVRKKDKSIRGITILSGRLRLAVLVRRYTLGNPIFMKAGCTF